MATDVGARIRAKFPLDEAVVEVWAGKLNCWSCEREPRIISGIYVFVGRHLSRFNLAEIGELDLFEPIRAGLGALAEDHRLGWRFSKARDRQWLCNGCVHCGAELGEYLDFDDWAFKEKVCSFAVVLDAKWRQAILDPEEARERAKAVLPPDIPLG